MKKLVIVLLIVLGGFVKAGNVTVSLIGINPMSINIRGNTVNEEAGNVSIYLYFNDDGVTDLTVGGVDVSQLETGFGWGTFLRTLQIQNGSWNRGGFTFTKRLFFDQSSILSPGDDFWTTSGINAIVCTFNTVGSGHAFVEVNGPDGLGNFLGQGHNVSYVNQDPTLPVELNSFSATTDDNKVILTWTTQSEVNNLGFEVYRSAEENGEYAMIASYENNQSLQGAGNSNAAREYTYEDRMLFNGETYWYQIADVDYQGVRTFHGPVSVESPDLIPEEYALHPNFPNPFNPETSIRFEIPANPASSKVKLVIYNNLGMEVRTLVNGTVEPGIHTVKWDGRNNAGEQIASGVYFLHIQAGTFNRTQKMLLVR